MGYPRMGEIRRYKVVPMTDEDIAKEKIEEIEKQIERGKLAEKEEHALWDCLFLSIQETADLLKNVQGKNAQPFLYPMVAMAAHTGARRSELIRSRLVDFDDDTVVIRERKKSKKQHTLRRVPLSPLLKKVMQAWLIQSAASRAVTNISK